MTTQWTIDSIAYVLPHPDLRQSFLREVHLAPRAELDAVLDRWESFAAQWTQMEAPQIERVRAYYQQHRKLPPEYESDAAEQAKAAFEDWRARMRATRGSNAA